MTDKKENLTSTEEKKRDVVMSGIRVTSERLHIGNYFGALKNWLELQHHYRCVFGIMDWHGMTTSYRSSKEIAVWRRELFAEVVAWGLDPEKNILFIQSQVPQHIELMAYFMNVTPMSWLERIPTWKDAEEEAKRNDTHSLGRFGYPVLMSADIALYQGTLVPVGKDQTSHLEFTRELLRRFNSIYGTKLPEPQPLFTETPTVIGTDGRKMSKSYGNTFFLTQEEKELKTSVNSMVTDPARVRREDKGDPNKCTVYEFHKLYSSENDLKWVVEGCTTAGIGCGDCKGRLAENINRLMQGPREKKKELLKDSQALDSMIANGCQRARDVAARTMENIRKKTKF